MHGVEDPVIRIEESFDSFYAREYRKVLGLAYVLSGSLQTAEDLTQEAFLAAHRQWETVRSLDYPAGWIKRVIANRSASAFQRRRVEAKAMALLAGRRRVERVELSPESEDTWKAVRDLPVRQREEIVFTYLAGYSVAEAAEILGCGTETIKTHLSRARNKLATRLEVPYDDR